MNWWIILIVVVVLGIIVGNILLLKHSANFKFEKRRKADNPDDDTKP